MFNPYAVVIGLFLLGGLLATLWGLIIILKARKTQDWPYVEGVIEESRLSSDKNDLLPYILFSYSIGERDYRQTMEFPVDITPSQEFAKSYVQKYPVGSRAQVYYDPDNPQNATLEPGLGKGDWLVLAMGLGMLVLGLGILFLSD
jgi:hypothetical protein